MMPKPTLIAELLLFLLLLSHLPRPLHSQQRQQIGEEQEEVVRQEEQRRQRCDASSGDDDAATCAEDPRGEEPQTTAASSTQQRRQPYLQERRQRQEQQQQQEQQERRHPLDRLPDDFVDPCRDDNPACPDWALEGECAANPNYMLGSCPRSCGSCRPIGLKVVGGAASGGAVDGAVDGAVCRAGGSSDECLAEEEKLCKDQYDECPHWAKEGECLINSQFMQVKCKTPVGNAYAPGAIEGRESPRTS